MQETEEFKSYVSRECVKRFRANGHLQHAYVLEKELEYRKTEGGILLNVYFSDL